MENATLERQRTDVAPSEHADARQRRWWEEFHAKLDRYIDARVELDSHLDACPDVRKALDRLTFS